MQAAETRINKKEEKTEIESGREIALKYDEIDWKEIFKTGGLWKRPSGSYIDN